MQNFYLMFEQKVDKETATKEVDRWLDAKKVMPSKRENNRDAIDKLVESVMYGQLIVTENDTLQQVLIWPLGDNESIKTLDYRQRINLETINARIKRENIKATDVDARIMAYAAALTSQPTAILGKMDTEDTGLMQSIVSFFF